MRWRYLNPCTSEPHERDLCWGSNGDGSTPPRRRSEVAGEGAESDGGMPSQRPPKPYDVVSAEEVGWDSGRERSP